MSDSNNSQTPINNNSSNEQGDLGGSSCMLSQASPAIQQQQNIPSQQNLPSPKKGSQYSYKRTEVDSDRYISGFNPKITAETGTASDKFCKQATGKRVDKANDDRNKRRADAISSKRHEDESSNDEKDHPLYKIAYAISNTLLLPKVDDKKNEAALRTANAALKLGKAKYNNNNKFLNNIQDVLQSLAPIIEEANISNARFAIPVLNCFMEDLDFEKLLPSQQQKNENDYSTTVLFEVESFLEAIKLGYIQLGVAADLGCLYCGVISKNGELRYTHILHSRETIELFFNWTDAQVDVATNLLQKIATGLPSTQASQLLREILSFSQFTYSDMIEVDDRTGIFQAICEQGHSIDVFAEFATPLLSFYKHKGVAMLQQCEIKYDYEKGYFKFIATNDDEYLNPKGCPFEFADFNDKPTNSEPKEENGATATAAATTTAEEDTVLPTATRKRKEEDHKIAAHHVKPDTAKELKRLGVLNFALIPVVIDHRTPFDKIAETGKELIEEELKERLAKKETKVDCDASAESAELANKTDDAVAPSATAETGTEGTHNADESAGESENANKETAPTAPAAAGAAKKDKKEKKEKDPIIAVGFEVFEQYSSPTAAFYHEASGFRAMARASIRVMSEAFFDFKLKKTRHIFIFVGLRFAEVEGKLKGTDTVAKTIQPVARHKIVTFKDVYAIFGKHTFEKAKAFQDDHVAYVIQAPPKILNEICANNGLNYNISEESNKINNKIMSKRFITSKEKYNKILNELNGKYTIQDRMDMTQDDGKKELHRATLKVKNDVSLDKMFQLATNLWKKYKITSTIRFGALRIFFTKHDLDANKLAELRMIEGVASVQSDATPFKAWDPQSAKKANAAAANLMAMSEENLKKQREDAAQKLKVKMNKSEEKLDVCARKVYCSQILFPKAWEELAKKYKAKVEMENGNCETVIFRWETTDVAANHGDGTPLYFDPKEGIAAFVGEIPKLKSK